MVNQPGDRRQSGAGDAPTRLGRPNDFQKGTHVFHRIHLCPVCAERYALRQMSTQDQLVSRSCRDYCWAQSQRCAVMSCKLY